MSDTREWGGALHLRVEQFSPSLGRVADNLARIAAAQADAAGEEVSLLVTPELSLTGYDLRDRTHSLAAPLDPATFAQLRGGPDVILGTVELGPGFVPFNTAVHLRAGEILHRHRKVYLPTYGMFDEGRYFGAGDRVRSYDAGGGWQIGMLVCEDLWHPALAYLLAMSGANLLVVQTAAAGRGIRDGHPARQGGAGRFASWAAWEHLAIAAAIAYGVYVVLANRVGVEGPCVFAGGSMIIAPDGSTVARADDRDEDRITAELRLDRVAAARRPFSHARDEDAHLLQRELSRLIGEGG
ncbi:MAG: carbon-nitrogen hydrolase [Gemmatimonadetes bacterium]|nr:carbon-nitrogen hydrolase [Gemmatimonadota bacterium]